MAQARTVTIAALMAFAAWLPADRTPAAEALILELDAGKHARKDVPIVWELPSRLWKVKSFRLARIDGGGGEIPVQRVDGAKPRLAWIARGDIEAGSVRRYRLLPGARAARSSAVVLLDDGSSLRFSYRDRPILRYNYGVVEPPSGVGSEYARSGYIHPVWNPSGKVITNDFPRQHLHHHGIWFPWTNTTFEGRKVDFWNSGKKEGRVEFVGMRSQGAGSVFAHFRSEHRFLDLTAPGGEKPVLDEVWDVRVWALRDGFLFDLESTQTCAGESPLLLHKYRYGGIGLRGSGEWEGPGENCRYLTSEGKTREDGHATRARWCDVYGVIDGRTTGVTVFCHPSNFRFPQHMRIHPSEPFFNFAPCQGGDFEISPGEPYISRYRFLVHDGAPDPEVLERVWRDYAEPPEVRMVLEGAGE